MLSISRFAASNRLCLETLAEALLSLSFLRAGVYRRPGSVDHLTDHLRRDVGLPARAKPAIDPRDLRW